MRREGGRGRDTCIRNKEGRREIGDKMERGKKEERGK